MIEWGQVVAFAVGIGAAVIAYFCKRWIEGRGPAERIERTSRLLDVYERMKRNNLSVEQLDSLDQMIHGKTSTQIAIEKTIRLRSIEDENIQEASRYVEKETQGELNAISLRDYESAVRSLETMLKDLDNVDFPDFAKEYISASQHSWEEYRDKQANLAASQFAGSSMYPLIRDSERERLTMSRIAEIEDMIEQMGRQAGDK